jgi:hypothetical protein
MSSTELESCGLSAAGESRRAEILARVLEESRRRRRRRTAAHLTIGAVPLAACMVAAWTALRPTGPAGPGHAAPAGPTGEGMIQVVATDPDVVRRWSIAVPASGIEVIGDDELLWLLTAEGRATGLVRTRGQVTVIGLTVEEPRGPTGMIPGQEESGRPGV